MQVKREQRKQTGNELNVEKTSILKDYEQKIVTQYKQSIQNDKVVLDNRL